MLTKLSVCNFKTFENIDIELGHPVVFIGPNNSGKTSALQALALWDIGLKRWNEKRSGTKAPEKRPGVTINRRDLISAPVPDANLLWYKLHVRDIKKNGGKQTTENIRIEIVVEGINNDKQWKCGLEFDYANAESLYCRPLAGRSGNQERMLIPEEASEIAIAFLPPMSGLSANEIRLDPGAINVRIGEGRTAEVLRNLCYILYEKKEQWQNLKEHILSLFRVDLEEPQYISERGEIIMNYKERGSRFDLSSSGRGLQQTLLLLAYMYCNPGAVLLLDEPDAHLEILRQRQIYNLLTQVANENGNQIIAASHSEVLLNEAANKDVVIAFLGKPHRINDRGSQVLKSLKDIGFEDYYLAEQARWVLYLEGSTDLSILQSFAQIMGYTEAIKSLERPFVRYVGNQPAKVHEHFFGLRAAVPDLKGIAIFDRLENVSEKEEISIIQWKKREIENYLCHREVLLNYARDVEHQKTAGPLFAQSEVDRRVKVMEEAIQEVERAMETLDKGSPWEGEMKVSGDFLPVVFEKYFKKLHLPNVMAKKNFHELARFVPKEMLDLEIRKKLETIVAVSSR